MSALAHLQTYALYKGMSALPPIATARADICSGAYAELIVAEMNETQAMIVQMIEVERYLPSILR